MLNVLYLCSVFKLLNGTLKCFPIASNSRTLTHKWAAAAAQRSTRPILSNLGVSVTEYGQLEPGFKLLTRQVLDHLLNQLIQWRPN